MSARIHRSLRSGVSFLELVIIMLVLSIFAAAGASRYSQSVDRFRAQNAARRIEADLQLAASEAQRVSSPRIVQFDVAGNSYELLAVSDIDDAGQPYVVDLANSTYAATLASADFSGSAVASFDMYGRPTNAGTVVVQSASQSQTVTLNADGSTSIP